jgi:hypothetical protein
MPLAFLEQELDDVEIELQRLLQANATEGRRVRRWFPDSEDRSFAKRHDLRDGCLSIEHGDRLASPDGPQVLAQTGFQFRDSHLLHDYIMTTSGQFSSSVRRRERLDSCSVSSGDSSIMKWPHVFIAPLDIVRPRPPDCDRIAEERHDTVRCPQHEYRAANSATLFTVAAIMIDVDTVARSILGAD